MWIRSAVFAVFMGAAVLSSACTTATRCEKDSDCNANGRCDQELKICFEREPKCDPECAEHLQCTSESGCVARYERVVVAQYAERVGNSGSDVTVQLELVSGRTRNDPPQLTLETRSPTGKVVRQELPLVAPGQYVARWVPSEHGVHELTAVHPLADLRSAPVQVTGDLTGPEFQVVVPPPPARIAGDGGANGYDTAPGYQSAWRRDETPDIHVTSTSTDVDPQSVRLVIWGTDGGSPTVPLEPIPLEQITPCNASYCGKAVVDFARPELHAFRGEFRIEAEGQDALGNPGQAEVAAKVTRWKWRWASPTGGLKATPAIGPTGTVYAGTIGESGGLYAFTPEGEFKWSVLGGGVTASPAVGTKYDDEVVYFVANGPLLSRLVSYRPDGTLGKQCDFGGLVSAVVSPMVTRLPDVNGDLREIVVAHSTEDEGVLFVHVPSSSANPCRTLPDAGSMTFPANLVAKEKALFLGNSGAGGVHAYSYDEALGTYVVQSAWVTDVGGFAASLAISGETLVGGWSDGIFSSPLDGGAPYVFSDTGTVGSPSVGSEDEIFWGNSERKLQRVHPGDAQSRSTTTGKSISAAPLLGSGEDYVVGAGQFSVLKKDSSLRWSSPIDGAGESSPAIDCSREGGMKQAGRPSVLYVGTVLPSHLYAIIVDARGLDVTAPWPKYQRDPYNSGSTSIPLSTFSCD